jgi:tRNA-(ms[2]io[6]A)-hydroxylase
MFPACPGAAGRQKSAVLLFREKVPGDWLPRILGNLPVALVDHAHLERKAATTALRLGKYLLLKDNMVELNAIAIEELQHFQLVLELLRRRGISFGPTHSSPWITGLMNSVRKGIEAQVIDHLLCCALIEGRSCEKFQILAGALEKADTELSRFYGSLVESEGNHYAAYVRMARGIDDAETERRLDFYLDLDAKLIRLKQEAPTLH